MRSMMVFAIVGLIIIATGLLFAADNCVVSGQDAEGRPFGATRQSVRNCQGKGCGTHTGHDCGPADIEITPKRATTLVGEPITMRFDATTMCNGQSVRNFKGTAKWEAGGFQCSLPDSYGFAKYTYQTGGTQTLTMHMEATCYDNEGESRCVADGTATIRVGRLDP